MTNTKPKEEKQLELAKYRDLVLATIDYYLETQETQIKTVEFDSVGFYRQLKIETENNFQKGRLTRLKQWFGNLTEMHIENGNLKFNEYLKEKTKYDIDIFKSYYKRVERALEKGKITTDNQFYDLKNMVDQLCQSETVDEVKIERLSQILADYENGKSRIKKPNT